MVCSGRWEPVVQLLAGVDETTRILRERDWGRESIEYEPVMTRIIEELVHEYEKCMVRAPK
jgi:hypothetical protein